MPTIEERLAALETKLAALTDTTPTTYYEHQYSGEEIDNAVSRALPNGAIDQAAGTFVRPNLLDNWYFGRPVDQRGWMLQLAGTMLYSDAACTQALFPSTKTTSIIKVSDIAAHPSDDSTVYVKLADCVRGYTGTWTYAIDRWLLGGEPYNTMEITDGGIHVSYTQPGWNTIQKLENVLCKGNTYTFSAVVKSTLPVRLVVSWGDNRYFFNEGFPATSEWALVTITGTVPNNAEIAYEQVALQPLGSVAGTMDIKAAKLELGPTQTLAHKEGDKWVLNEIPDYGDQLRRCLRHDYILGNTSQNCPIGVGTAYSNDGVVCVIQLPEYMRTNPAVVLSGEVQIRFSATQILTATSVLNYGFSGDKVQLYFPGLSGLTPDQSCDLYTQIGSRLEFNSNL